MCLSERLDLLDRVELDRNGHILLSVLKPLVEGRSLLGKGEPEAGLLNLPELFLYLEKPLFTGIAVALHLVPAVHDFPVLVVDILRRQINDTLSINENFFTGFRLPNYSYMFELW